MTGALIVAPLLILWIQNPRPDLVRRRPLEAACLCLVTILVGLAVFGEGVVFFGLRTFLLTFFCTLPLLWAAFRFRQREAAVLIAVLSGIAIWAMLRGSGPFAGVTANESLLLLQSFMGTVSVMILSAAALVEERLDVAHVASGKIVLSCEPLNLATSVQRCVSVLAGTGRLERHIVDVQAEPAWAHADPTRLDQIVSNLLANAAKYTPPGGTIRVRVRGEGDEAVVRVADTGIGIPAGLLPRIFDLFVQDERGFDHAKQEGLGVGLTLVRRLVGLHGGRVEASSDGPGRGSEFVVRLPRIAPAPAEDVARPPASQRHRILIVDDNPAARQMLRLTLELAGDEVEVAEDGHRALDLAESGWPEVVLIDTGLPGMDGYEVARRLRASSRGPEMHLLALTGFGQPRDYQRGPGSDFDAYLMKPVDPEELVRTIGTVAPTRVNNPVDNPVGKRGFVSDDRF